MRFLVLFAILLSSPAWAQTGVLSGGSVTATGSTTARTLANRAADAVNVKDFGAVLDGTTNDAAAFNSARGAVSTNGTVVVPAGGWLLNTAPSTGPTAGNVLWKLSGNAFGTGTSPVIGILQDVVETYYGGKFFGRTTTSLLPATVRIDSTFNYVVATTGAVAGNQNSLWVVGTVPAPTSSTTYAGAYSWNFLAQMTDSHIGPAQNVNGGFQMTRPIGAITAFGTPGPIWSMSSQIVDQTGLSSTLAGSMVGFENDVAGNDDDPGTAGDGGDRVALAMNAQTWSTNAIPLRVGHGLTFGANAGAFWGSMVDFKAPWDTAALDFSHANPLAEVITTTSSQGSPGVTIPLPHSSGVTVGATVTGSNIAASSVVVSKTTTSVTLNNSSTSAVLSGTALTFTAVAPAIRLAANQFFAWDATSAHTMAYNSGLTYLYYAHAGVPLMEIYDSGVAQFGNAQINNGLGIAFFYNGSNAIGVDMSAGTFSTTAAFQMAANQVLSLNNTQSITMGVVTGLVLFRNTGVTMLQLASGVATVPGTLNVQTAYQANGTAGVACSGSPTSGFVSTLGIVTHC